MQGTIPRILPRSIPRPWQRLLLCYRYTLLGLVVLLLTGCAGRQGGTLETAEVGGQIRQHYDAVFMTLPDSQQRHYAQRLYRVTGEDRYLPPNQAYAKRLLASLGAEIRALDDPTYPLRRGQQMADSYAVKTRKQRSRKALLAQWPEVAYARRLAFQLTQARYHGLLNETDLPGYQRALEYLASVDFEPFLTDPGAIDIYAAQLANLAYYLYGLGVADLRQQAATALQAHYPPHAVASLNEAAYRNRLYGMTHFVIAASEYYQCPVDAGDFRWVLEAFAAELPRILATKADIYAEVGISFLLAGHTEHPALEPISQALRDAYAPEARMIPGESGDLDLARGEHRNVLAIMLLGWPERLYPGPVLSATASASLSAAQTTAPRVCEPRGAVAVPVSP